MQKLIQKADVRIQLFRLKTGNFVGTHFYKHVSLNRFKKRFRKKKLRLKPLLTMRSIEFQSDG